MKHGYSSKNLLRRTPTMQVRAIPEGATTTPRNSVTLPTTPWTGNHHREAAPYHSGRLQKECTLPRGELFAQADKLRKALADAISEHQADSLHPNIVLSPLRNDYAEEAVWDAAMRSPHYENGVYQDLPLIECGKRGLHTMIDSFLTILPWGSLSKERISILEARGHYGRTALQHAVDQEQWQAVDILIRHGCYVGTAGDRLGTVSAILKAAEQRRAAGGSWRNIDHKFKGVFNTLMTRYGDHWATHPLQLDERVSQPFIPRLPVNDSLPVSVSQFDENKWKINFKVVEDEGKPSTRG